MPAWSRATRPTATPASPITAPTTPSSTSPTTGSPPCPTARSPLIWGKTPRPGSTSRARPSSPSTACPGPSRCPISSTAPRPWPRTLQARPAWWRSTWTCCPTPAPRSTAATTWSSPPPLPSTPTTFSLWRPRGLRSSSWATCAPFCSWSCPARSSTSPSGWAATTFPSPAWCCWPSPPPSSSSTRSRTCGRPRKRRRTPMTPSMTAWT